MYILGTYKVYIMYIHCIGTYEVHMKYNNEVQHMRQERGTDEVYMTDSLWEEVSRPPACCLSSYYFHNFTGFYSDFNSDLVINSLHRKV